MMMKTLRIAIIIFFMLNFSSGNIFAQELTIIEPNGDNFCISEPYMYVAQLNQATSFDWEVTNPMNSPQPSFTISGAKSDTIFITWYVPSFIQDIPNINIIKVIAKNGDTSIDSLDLIVDNIIESPFVLPIQQITQSGDTIACGDMTSVFLYSYPTSTQQEFSATIEPPSAGKIVVSSQWPPLQDPIAETRIYWNESFTGSATATVITSNDCGIDKQEYHYFKEPNTAPNNGSFVILGQDSICQNLTTYAITDSTDIFVSAFSVIPENAIELTISRDSFYLVDGNMIGVKYIDVYWESDFSGSAQLILHDYVECSTEGVSNNFINLDTLNISVCEGITSAIMIDNEIMKDLVLFPNPIKVGNTINFTTTIEDNSTIDIIQISSGQIIQSGTLSNLNSGFNLSSQVTSGLYMVRISSKNSKKQFHAKLIVIE